MIHVELTVSQAQHFDRVSPRLKALAKSRAFRQREPVALTHKGRTLYIAHPNGKTTCGGCGTCKRCLTSQARAEERAVD